jgi:putative glutamine amidotransferase
VSSRPLIGVSTSEMRADKNVTPLSESEPRRLELALGMQYPRAIDLAGGVPVVLPPLEPEDAEDMLGHLSGVCISGGPDLHPSTYGAEPNPHLGPTEPEVDRFELALLHYADEHDLPVLAICRGAQALNISRGGTLVQHLPDVIEGDIDHRQTKSGDQPTHAVELLHGSLLARTLGLDRAEVNSFHHQAIDRLGVGVRAVAWSPDGVIEGIEAVDREFALGVQWHAEGIVGRPEQIALFSSFIAAARRFAGERPRVRAA